MIFLESELNTLPCDTKFWLAADTVRTELNCKLVCSKLQKLPLVAAANSQNVII